MYKPHIATLPLPLSQRISLHHSASSPPFSPAFAPFRRRSHRTSANLRPPPHTYTTSPQRTFIYQHSASLPPTSPAFAPFYRRSHRTSATLRSPPDIYTTTPQRTFIYQHTHAPPQHYTPSPTKLCTNSANSAHLHQATYVRSHSFLTEESERLNDGNGAVLPCKRIVSPMQFERLYGGIGKKSIEYPRKVYRVFRKSL